ncbi:MAG: carbohydrate-binding protein, partial [Kiritimatiellia bacterium]|nr:carbohydrate-binding protein [Kiritimatiellia bacterium]
SELAWHIYLKGLDSGFNYYGGLGNDDELKPALATKNAIDKLQGFMSSRMAKDKTPPTVLKPQRFPYNPGAYTFGWFNRVPQVNEAFLKKMGSEFYIWTHAYDVSGVQTINVKIRIDNDGVNSMQSTHNETYAGGSEVGSWVTIPMTKRVLPKTRTELNAKADNGQIDFVVFDPAYWADPQIADYYFAKITDQNLNGFRGKLLDYYIEATDTRGNTQKSEIQHVWVEHDGGQSSVAPSATFDPTNPSDCAPITVNFNAATSPLATAAVVNVSYHFSTNSGDWVQTAMTRTSTNTFTYTFNTVPDNAPQLEVAFTDGVNWENNGGANWKTAIRDCDAPVNGVLFDPAAPNGCDPVTIRYYPAGRPLDGAASVYIHVGRNGWQDTISPDPLMTQVGSYWEYIYVVEDDTVAIDVVFNNGAGLWDSNGGSDWHVAVTNCGSMPEPLPAVSINPAAPVGCGPITITYNPSGRVLLGADPVKIHIGRNGWQDVILPNPNMTKSGSTWTYAYTPPPGTTNINMVFNDGGAVWDNNTEMNWNFAVVGCEDIPTGLAITNPAGNITVPFATTHANLQGIAEGLTGHLAWTNSLTGAAGTLPAAATWSLPGLALAVGGNEFVVSGSNTTAAGTTTTAIDDASDAAYSDGWNTGNNGGSGFLGWTLNVTSNAGHFISAETGFGLWAQSESLSEAIRPFSSPLAVGKTFSVRMKNGYVQEGAGGLGVALQNATGDTLWQFWFNGGDTNYNRSGGTTDVAWTMSPIALTVEMTGDTTYNLTVQPEGEAARSYSGTLEDNADQSVTRFRTWLWNNGEGSDYDFYVNNLMITAPSAGNVETHSDFVVITRQSGGTPPPFTMELNPDFTGSGLGFRLATSEAGAQYAVWASPILFPTQNWQMIVGTETQATGGPIDLSITNGLLPINFYRIGYTISP